MNRHQCDFNTNAVPGMKMTLLELLHNVPEITLFKLSDATYRSRWMGATNSFPKSHAALCTIHVIIRGDPASMC